MKRQNVRSLLLLATTISYLLVGAVIFDKLESEHEKEERHRLIQQEQDLKQNLSISDEDFELLRRTVIMLKPYQAGIQWKFAGGLYFALSVITTIGYGHSTPKTLEGKIFCMFYATIGIPLNIVMFQSIGERFNIFLAFLIAGFKRRLRLSNTKVSEVESVILCGLLCVVVLLGGACAFRGFEHWMFIDSFYYCFVTMSTIGFGDYVALQNETALALQTQPGYVTFCFIYILCGLTVFAAALNKMVLGLLTMNTADERKDELQAQEEALRTPTLNGDIIMTNNSNSFSNGTLENGDVELGCSYSRRLSRDSTLTMKPTYFKSAARRKKLRNHLNFSRLRYSARHRPCQSVSHLLPLQPGNTPLLERRKNESVLSFLSLNGEQDSANGVRPEELELTSNPSQERNE